MPPGRIRMTPLRKAGTLGDRGFEALEERVSKQMGRRTFSCWLRGAAEVTADKGPAS